MEEEQEVQRPEEEARADPVQMLSGIMQMDNVAEHLTDEMLGRIADDVLTEHEIDWKSMKPWRDQMEKGIDLASLVKEEKTYPWKKATNVKYPLITTAALQFNARSYPAIVAPEGMVKGKAFGSDPQGLKAARADRVGAFMSWQLSSEIEEWEETTDELLTILPIVGTAVRKVWFDPTYGRIRVRLIEPGCFVVNKNVKTLTEAPRIGEVLNLFPAEIEERRNSGFYRDIDYVETEGEDKDAPQEFIEQHRRIDLDGDGYGEPYIVVVHKLSRKIARIVADFEQEDVKLGPEGVVAIKRGSYFVAYHFLPPISGGFFGTGLGFLLGDISESINSIINMMMDAGHMASLGGGFLGADFRIKGGATRFQPGEWKKMNAKGGELRNSIVPMTFPGPDATLFQLLGLLIDAGREVASVKDIMTGDSGGQNMTATTTLALIEQGMMVFTAAYKRIFRGLKKEFKLIAKINAETVDPAQYLQFHDEQVPPEQAMMLFQQDFNMADMDVEPVADPRSVTKMQEAAKAQVLMELAQMGMADPNVAGQRVLEASSIPDREELMPKPDPAQQQMAQMQMQGLQADLQLKMVEIQQALADIEKTRTDAMKNLADAGAAEAGVHLDLMKARLEAIRDGLGKALDREFAGMERASRNGASSGMPDGNAGPGRGIGQGGMAGGQRVAGGGPFGPAAAAGDAGGFV